ncbi:hypothetical protein GCM10010193_67860 [Kitasatospora atroaurantiaca]|uniref:FAD-dependent oxidoreductase n=1 Tax=Kitasatospora atroaurantiaca TaxID=285545 RepID=UPI0011A0EE85|nr:hypothetical protein [Kitasatospora atroaurantiaca]
MRRGPWRSYIGLTWLLNPGVTLLGDATHLVSSFVAVGADLALRDAAELANAVADAEGDCASALTTYEKALVPRSTEMAQVSAENLDLLIARTAPSSSTNCSPATSRWDSNDARGGVQRPGPPVPRPAQQVPLPDRQREGPGRAPGPSPGFSER